MHCHLVIYDKVIYALSPCERMHCHLVIYDNKINLNQSSSFNYS
jgi:hypothetical protein